MYTWRFEFCLEELKMKDFIIRALTLFALIFGILCGVFSLVFAGQTIDFIIDNKPLSEPCLHMILSILGCSVSLAIFDELV